jgi:pSer/pThr/pTyr-binding forkhead associated (FHA) protein
MIRKHGGSLMLRDCGSSNGTRINGLAVTAYEEQKKISSGDLVSFGAAAFHFLSGDDFRHLLKYRFARNLALTNQPSPQNWVSQAPIPVPAI